MKTSGSRLPGGLRAFVVLAALTLCTCFSAVARARPPARPLPSEAPHRVSVLTMGPGDHPFSRFGHTALLLQWRGQSRVYNFGTFAFDGWRGVQEFLEGRFRYWLSVSSLSHTLAAYRADNRSVVAQDLDLTREQRAHLARALEANARPENRYYDYDYYQDNCTTRVRDALNDALGGKLEDAFRRPGKLSYRQHTHRLSAEDLALYVGLDTALGRPIDRVPDRYGELWVPDVLAAGLDEVTLERDGRRLPLVQRTRVLAQAERPPPRREPPRWASWFALTGCALGAGLAALGHVAAGKIGRQQPSPRLKSWARATLGWLLAVLGLFGGLLGSVLLGFWATKHWATHQNWNLLLFAPWALPLAITGARLALTRNGAHEGAARLTVRLLAACAGLATLGALLARLPGVEQDNLRLAVFMVPVWLGLLWGTSALLTPAPSSH